MAEAAQVLRLSVTAAAATAPEIPREAAPNGTAPGRVAGSCPRSGRAEAENQTADRTHHYTRRTVRLRARGGCPGGTRPQKKSAALGRRLFAQTPPRLVHRLDTHSLLARTLTAAYIPNRPASSSRRVSAGLVFPAT